MTTQMSPISDFFNSMKFYGAQPPANFFSPHYAHFSPLQWETNCVFHFKLILMFSVNQQYKPMYKTGRKQLISKFMMVLFPPANPKTLRSFSTN